MAARVREVDGHGETEERATFLAEELLEDAFLASQERVRDAALRLEVRAHDVEHARAQTAGRLELVEDHHHALSGTCREGTREIQCPFEETLRVLLARELEGELDVLVLHLHRRPHAGSDRLRLLEAAFDA